MEEWNLAVEEAGLPEGDMVNVSVRLALGISLAKRLSPLARFGGWDLLRHGI